MIPPDWGTARRHLARRCPVMRHLTARIGPCTLRPCPDQPFTALVRAVLAQQISTRAARAVFTRLLERLGDPIVTPEALAALDDEQLRACGISGPKRRTLRALTDHTRANPQWLDDLTGQDDDTVRRRLTAVRGIGPWTADMVLIFGLGRPDVLAVGDYGVRVAAQRQFGLPDLPDSSELTRLAGPWRPYRTVACWYLWRSLELAAEPVSGPPAPGRGRKRPGRRR